MRWLYALGVAALMAANALPAAAQTPAPVPAATTIPPVYVPPATWAQVPRGFSLFELKNLWQGPRARMGRQGLFGEAVLPIPAGLVGAIVAQVQSSVLKSKVPFSVKTATAKVCGATATVRTFAVTSGKGKTLKTDALIENTLFTQNGLTYGAIYARPPGPVNPAIETAIRNSCPLPNGDLPALTPPAGWNPVANGLDFELAGIWLGNAPMQTITLIQGAQIPSPVGLIGMFKPVEVHRNGQLRYSVKSRKTTYCGQPGILVNTQFIVPPGFGMSYDLAAVQGTTATYILSYFHPSSYTDTGAQQSLLTLCGGPAPAASSTPAPAKP